MFAKVLQHTMFVLFLGWKGIRGEGEGGKKEEKVRERDKVLSSYLALTEVTTVPTVTFSLT